MSGIKRHRIDLFLLGVQPFISLIAPFSLYMFGGIRTIFLFLLIFVSLFYRRRMINNNSKIIAVLIGISSLVYLLSLMTTFTLPSIGVIWGMIYAVIILKYKREDQLAAFNIFIKIFSCLLVLSLIEFFLAQVFGISIIIGNVTRIQTTSDTIQDFNHHIFNLIKDDLLPRFQSLTSEPGDVGTICGLLLFIIGDKKEYRFPLIVFILSGLLTFSLAFYALVLIYATVVVVKQRSIYLVFVFAIVAFFVYYYFGDVFQDRIIYRAETVEGLSSRSNDDFDRTYTSWLERGDSSLLFGNGNGATNEMSIGKGVVGYKRELFDYGFVGVFLFLLSYFISFFKYNKWSMKTILFWGVFMISWLQRSYFFFTPYLILVFNVYNVFNEDIGTKSLCRSNSLVNNNIITKTV